jgi:hypothetical protein
LRKTASTIDWLEELGVEFDFVQSQAGSRISWHIPTGSPKPGVQFVKSLTDAAQKMGLPTEFATSVSVFFSGCGWQDRGSFSGPFRWYGCESSSAGSYYQHWRLCQ